MQLVNAIYRIPLVTNVTRLSRNLMNKMIVAIKIRVAAKRKIKRLLIYFLLIRKMNLNNYLSVVLIRFIFSVNIFIKLKFTVCF